MVLVWLCHRFFPEVKDYLKFPFTISACLERAYLAVHEAVQFSPRSCCLSALFLAIIHLDQLPVRLKLLQSTVCSIPDSLPRLLPRPPKITPAPAPACAS